MTGELWSQFPFGFASIKDDKVMGSETGVVEALTEAINKSCIGHCSVAMSNDKEKKKR